MRLAGRAQRRDRAVLAMLTRGEQHIDALARAIYGARSRRAVRRTMRVVSRLRQRHRISYDRARRVYVLAG